MSLWIKFIQSKALSLFLKLTYNVFFFLQGSLDKRAAKINFEKITDV